MEEIVNFDTLLTLIDDRDEEVFFAVRDRLLQAGPDILPVLEHALSSSASLLQHERLELIIYQLKIAKLVEDSSMGKCRRQNTVGGMDIGKFDSLSDNYPRKN